jgi:hypothetical protein
LKFIVGSCQAAPDTERTVPAQCDAESRWRRARRLCKAAAMLTRMRLTFMILLTAMLFVALAPGTIIGAAGSGENRHALAFAVLPAVSALAWPRVPLLWHFAAYAALGGAIELAQAMVSDFHTAQWDDWLVDMAAAAAALGAVALVRRRLARI